MSRGHAELGGSRVRDAKAIRDVAVGLGLSGKVKIGVVTGDDVLDRLDEFIESGVQHFELKIIYPTMDSLSRQMELWAENILPRYN